MKITRKKSDAAIMMSHKAWVETVYLLKSPRNAKRLLTSIEALERGDALEKNQVPLLHEHP